MPSKEAPSPRKCVPQDEEQVGRIYDDREHEVGARIRCRNCGMEWAEEL